MFPTQTPVSSPSLAPSLGRPDLMCDVTSPLFTAMDFGFRTAPVYLGFLAGPHFWQLYYTGFGIPFLLNSRTSYSSYALSSLSLSSLPVSCVLLCSLVSMLYMYINSLGTCLLNVNRTFSPSHFLNSGLPYDLTCRSSNLTSTHRARRPSPRPRYHHSSRSLSGNPRFGWRYRVGCYRTCRNELFPG